MAVFEGIQGPAPERAARLTGLVQQCRSVMADDGDVDATQRLLHELGIGVLDSILVTRQLLGAGPGDLGQAKTIVLNSPWRESELRAHQQFVDALERAEEVADAIRNLPRTKTATRIVAIDGAGGSGKTTLAATVAELLDGTPVIVYGDDFYRPMAEHEREELGAQQGYHRYFDWERLRDQVLAPLQVEHTACYQRFDWATGELGARREVVPGAVVIVEGVYVARPELAHFYQLTVYVDTPREVCLERMRARGENPEEWIIRWRAAEDFYLRTTSPRPDCNLSSRATDAGAAD